MWLNFNFFAFPIYTNKIINLLLNDFIFYRIINNIYFKHMRIILDTVYILNIFNFKILNINVF